MYVHCTLQGKFVLLLQVEHTCMYVLFKEILHITNGTNMYVCTLQGKRVKRKPLVGSAGSYIRPSTGASARDARGARILTNTNTPPQRQGQIQIHHCEDKDKYNKHIRLLLTSENYYILIVRPILIWLGGGN